MLQVVPKDVDTVDAHLARARQLLDNGNDSYRLARTAIIAAQDTARAEGRKLSNRDVAKTLGRSHRWVNQLLKWSGTEGSTPFEKRVDGSDRTEPDESPEETFRLREHDAILMGDHILVIGDATSAHSKIDAFAAAGLPFLKEFIDSYAVEEDHRGVVVVTDPPYGVEKKGIRNDHEADWKDVYRLFHPRGGFAFAAYKPPEFLKAQRGIEKAGWKVRHYLAMHNGGGRPWRRRVQNSIDAIFFFERPGETVWPVDEISPSLLKPDQRWQAKQERKEIAAGHPTSKPVNVLMDLIRLISSEGDFILDPFAGTGSTLVACMRTGRRFIGVEIDPKNAEKAVRTWQREARKTDPQAQAIVDRDFIGGLIPYDDLQPEHPSDIWYDENGDYYYRKDTG